MEVYRIDDWLGFECRCRGNMNNYSLERESFLT